MPQHVVLDNGAKLDIPDGMSRDEIRSHVSTMNTMIKLGVPNYIKSGKALWDAAQSVAGSAGRIAGAGVDLFPPFGAADMTVGGVNALKPLLAERYPALRSMPDIPTVSGLSTAAIGAPPMPQDAPGWQRYAESAITGAANAGSRAMNTARMLMSTGGGDIGGAIAQRFGGPDWEKAGRWLGSWTGSTPEKTVIDPVRAVVQRTTAGPQAPAVDEAAQRLRDQGINVRPTFGSLATIPGRTVEKAFGAIPFVNWPINAAKNQMEEGILAARRNAAEDVNQGPLPPDVDVGTIGGNMISLARTRSAAIKADAAGRFDDLDRAVGQNTLVNSAPLVREMQSIMRGDRGPMSADQKQQIQNRIDYLNSMTYGQPYYEGPTFSGSIQPRGSITIGQLSKFRSELGADLQSIPALDTVSQGHVRDAITRTIRPVYDKAGYGPQYDQANENYARSIGPGTVTEALDTIGGVPVRGKPGLYEGGMNEQQAHDFLKRNMRSASSLEPFVDPNSPYWRAAASQYISQIGGTGQDFRTDTFGNKVAAITPEVQTQLTQGPTGGARSALQMLNDAGLLGQNTSVPVSRHGLTNSIGTFAAVEALLGGLGEHFANAGVPAMAAIPVGMGLARALESQPMTDAMAGRGTTTPLVDALYQGMPYAAASYNLNNPDDPRNQPQNAPRPPSLVPTTPQQ
jgi:hypothetical protein